MSNQKVVPFGKWKGQPVQRLAEDRSYFEWLCSQPWFREKFEDLYQAVVQRKFEVVVTVPGAGAVEPSETPAHNAIQVLFLEDEFCRQFVREALPVWPEVEGALEFGRTFEFEGVDVLLVARAPEDEHGYCRSQGMAIEIKPSIGDDYPAVLRQMRGHRANNRLGYYLENQVLLVGEFNARGATIQQFIKTFEVSGIRVVFLDDVVDPCPGFPG